MCSDLLMCHAKNQLLQHIGGTIEHKFYNSDDNDDAIQGQHEQE